jgi:hypothetical protein
MPQPALNPRPDLLALMGGGNVQPPTADLGAGQFIPTPPDVQARMAGQQEAMGGGQLPARELALELLRALMQLIAGGPDEGELPPVPPFDPRSLPIEELPPAFPGPGAGPTPQFETMSPQDAMIRQMMQQVG